jgi:hypothetical protein
VTVLAIEVVAVDTIVLVSVVDALVVPVEVRLDVIDDVTVVEHW